MTCAFNRKRKSIDMKQLLQTIMLLMPMLADAETIEIEGLYYNLMDKGNAAEVVKAPEGYSGEVSIPETVTYEGKQYSVTSIGDMAFDKSSNLLAIHIPESIKRIGTYAFASCEKLDKIFITNLTSWCNITFVELPFYYPHKLILNDNEITQLDIPDGITFVSDYAFCYLSGLEKVTVPNSVLSIGANAFTGCVELGIIELSDGITKIRERAFQGCSNLNTINLPNSISQIDDYVFSGCGFTSIDLPNSITILGNGVFSSCKNLVSISLPNNLSTLREGMFLACFNLNSVVVPNSVTYIMRDAFRDCTRLTSISLSSNLTSIEKYAFYGCRSLENISIPDNVLGIADYAFGYCHKLKNISLGKKLNWIGEQGFAFCEAIENVYCYAEEPPYTSNDVFKGSYTEQARLYVPDAVIGAYNSTTPWSGFGEVKPLSESSGLSSVLNHDVNIQGHNGLVKITGLTNGIKVGVYNVSGMLLGGATSMENEATIETRMRAGDIAIIHIGNNSYKVIMQ